MRTTNITGSLLDVYDTTYGEVLPLPLVDEICLQMALDKAFGAAMRPKDAPNTVNEALRSPDRTHWQQAMEVEMLAHISNGTWDLVELPEDRKVIGSRWVFIVKRNADGSIDKYKARLVAQGFTQMPGVDYDQTFSPATRLATLRVVLVKAALNGEYIETIDISNAYLNGEIEKEYEVYMRQPPGFEQRGPNGEKWVCRLRKGLYGLKQSGRLWNQKLTGELERIGFHAIKSDPAVYIMEKEGVRIIMPVFVDDITITSKDRSQIQWVKDSLAKVFKLKDLGPTKFLLGIQIDYDQAKCTIALSQRQYILDILTRFKMSDCSPVSTPMDPGSGSRLRKYVPDPDKPEDMSKVPYMSAVGALMYLAIGTRPDIMFTVGKLAQYNANPGPQHWQAVKHVMRYLQGTKDLRLTFRPTTSDPMSSELCESFSDADHAGCLDTRRSTSGFLVRMVPEPSAGQPRSRLSSQTRPPRLSMSLRLLPDVRFSGFALYSERSG
jgi:hypothetical protein